MKTHGDNNSNKKVLIHIQCDSGNGEQLWIKVIARDAEAISDEIEGNCGYGHKDILQVAEQFIKTANNFCSFRPPKVIFDFLHQIDNELEEILEEKGIQIGRKFREMTEAKTKISNCVLNVDITTMIAYVSELSNGGQNFFFNDKFIDMQAGEERENPVKPIIDEILKNKILIACETAVNSFQNIIDVLGGVNECKRAEKFLERLQILPDIENPSEILNVELTSHIKERSRKIFAFGIFHSAVTVTSNSSFTRAIKMKNYEIPTIFHSARALTEKKQNEIK